MKIIVEGFPYEKDSLEKLKLNPSIKIENNDQYEWINAVGYYKNNYNEVFLLIPKVFEKDDFIFKNIPIKELINQDVFSVLKKYSKSQKEMKIINDLFSMLYRTLDKTNSTLTNDDRMPNVISNIKQEETILLNVIYSLININKENGFIYYRKKILNNKPSSKLNWKKTMSKNNSVLLDGDIFYLDTVYEHNKLYQDELLLLIFYSLLKQLKKRYGYEITLEEDVPTFSDREYNKNESKFLKQLKQMRYSKFDDISSEILQLLILYYEQVNLGRNGKAKEELFITTTFNLVFEKMIDELISDKEDLSKFKSQRDGKTLDHIFHFKSPIAVENTFFVGDSKYYKFFKNVSEHSVFKQFTYARNLIQQYMYDLKRSNLSYYEQENIVLHSKEFSSYNVIPNFFIFPDYNEKETISFINHFQEDNSHYENQIFDRDSHTILYFKVDLYFLMKEYIKREKSNIIRDFICKKVNEYYLERYEVYEMIGDNIEEGITKSFQLLGKIFNSPYLLLEKNHEENTEVIDYLSDLNIRLIRKDFVE